MRAGVNKPDSVHYFHSYAVADRVDFTSLSDKVIPTLQHDKKQLAMSLLPAPEDDEALQDNIVIQMSRILFENMEFFRLSLMGLYSGTLNTNSTRKCQQDQSWLVVSIITSTPIYSSNA